MRILAERRFKFEKELTERKASADTQLAERKSDFDADLAERKFRYDRELHDHKRRVEFAETILADFLQIADVIQAVRSPGGFWGEAAGRQRSEGETDDQSRQLDSYYVPLARLTQQSDLISELMSKRYRAHAILGSDIDQAFQKIENVIKESADFIRSANAFSEATRIGSTKKPTQY